MNKIDNKKNLPWLDIMRAISAILVMVSHVPNVPVVYGMFFAPVTIPIFFFVSGYLSKNYTYGIGRFLYNRVLKLLIFQFIIEFELHVLSVTVLIKTLQNPMYLVNLIAECTWKIIIGESQWFIPCLIVVSIYFIIINKLCKDKAVLMIPVSLVLAAIGLYVSVPEHISNWSWDTALVCQLFYVIGYCIKQKQIISKFEFTTKSCVQWGILYISIVIIFAIIFGPENIFITVANNNWKCIPITSILILIGTIFLICLSHKIEFSKTLIYIGKHSMLYFAIGGLIMMYLYQGIQYLYQLTHFEPFNNIYLTCIPIIIASTLLTLIPCWLSDKFCPILNGTINLPQLKFTNKESD